MERVEGSILFCACWRTIVLPGVAIALVIGTGCGGHGGELNTDPLHTTNPIDTCQLRKNGIGLDTLEELSAASAGHVNGKADTDSVIYKKALGLAEFAFGKRDAFIDSNASAIRHLEKARELFDAVGDKKTLAHVELILGQIHGSTGDMDRSIRYLQPASLALMASGDTLGAARGVELIGYMLQLQGNRIAAQAQYEQALALLGHRHPQQRLDVLVQLGALRVEIGHADSALVVMAEASALIEIGSAIDPRDDVGAVKGEALLLNGKCREALELLNRSLQQSADRPDRHDMKAYVLARIAKAQSCTGGHRRAFRSAFEGLRLAEGCGNVKEQMDNLQALVVACEGLGDVAKAFIYSKRYHALNDSIADARVASAVTGALLTAEFRSTQVTDSLTNVLNRRESDAVLSRSKMQRNILLLVSLLVPIIAGLLLNRSRLKRRVQEEQLRARLARDLHDDIGSTLSSISILSSLARKRVEADGNADASDALEKINDRSQRLMRNMSDIVWSVDPTKDSLEDLLARMCEFSTSLFESKGIAHSFEQPAVIPAVCLPVETRNNLYPLFKEAVNNTAKHSQCNHAQVTITLENGILCLVVRDDGKGMHLSSAHANGHGGNGLRNMRQRAAEMRAELIVNSVPASGTSITLEVPLRG